jgi:peptidoglycan/LPS O-acetylase OafA/YrhL
MVTTPPQRLPVLDMLRGLASFAVCWFHMTNGRIDFLPPGTLKTSGAFGWLGVDVFFVISGFVIPFALKRSGYGIRDSGTFLLKRVVRLDPPYFVTIGLVILLGYLSTKAPRFQGPPFTFSLPQTLLHVGYLNTFFHYPWLNPVFWSLAIELQYYLLIALIFPLLVSRRSPLRIGTMLVLATLSLGIPAAQFVFHWLLLFLFGIVTFQFRAGLLSRTMYLAYIAVITVGGFFCYGILICLTGLASALVIAFVNVGHVRGLTWLGAISYSLYLLHAPIGGRIINLSSRFATTLPTKFLAVIVATAVSILAAWGLYKLVERPAQQWSAGIGYRKKEIAPSGFASKTA